MLVRIIGIAFLVVSFIIFGFTFFRPSMQLTERKTAITNEAASSEDTNFVQADTTRYIPYSPEVLAHASQNKGSILLFFYEEGCQSCQAVERDMLSKLENIPTHILVLKAYYNSEKDLKQKYEVTAPHTFVQIDNDGNEVTKWEGSDTLEQVLARMK